MDCDQQASVPQMLHPAVASEAPVRETADSRPVVYAISKHAWAVASVARLLIKASTNNTAAVVPEVHNTIVCC
jgi:hypothetical protein